MFDATSLLNTLLSGGAPATTATGATGSVSSIIDAIKAEGAQLANQASAAVSGAAGKAESSLQGTQAGDLMGKAQGLAAANPMATAAAGAGLAALLFGTGAGRAVVGQGVKLGGLAMLGGLAYRAFQNFESGKPLTSGMPGMGAAEVTAAPAGTAFHEDNQTADGAHTILRAMTAAAAADGHIDASERARLLESFKASGIAGDAASFFENELLHPATIADIAKAVGTSQELAVQVYAGARLATGSVTPSEESFLKSLAKSLPLSPELVAHIDAAAAAHATAA